MATEQILVLGTRNRKKGIELSELLAPYGFALKTLADFPDSLEVEETGSSFGENAHLKATEQARHLNQWVVGEDSGISVDALDGAPGIYSARFSGENATDQDNNEKMLASLENVALEKRTAHYTCHISLCDPAGVVRADCEAYCRGRIRFTPAGTAGFGYDPLFEVAEYHRTFGELGDQVKSVLSHRSRAIQKFLPQLLDAFVANHDTD